MTTWRELSEREPDLAQAGRALLYQVGVGLAFLATVRRDGLYAMHSFPCDDNEDAFHISGTAQLVTDAAIRDALGRQFVAERTQFGAALPAADDALFEFDIDSCLLTRTTGHGDPAPKHLVWRADV